MQRRDVIREIVNRDNQKLQIDEQFIAKDAKRLYDAACQHFGTWDIALRYAGVTIKSRRRKKQDYSREQLRMALRRLCRHSCSLSPNRVKQRNARLYRAAIKYYGSWNDALEAAGINWRNVRMDSRPRRHDKQKFLETLRELHRSGHTLAWREVCYENREILQTAKNLYGSWSAALAEAGILAKKPGGRKKNRKWDAGKVITEIQERHRQNKSVARKDVMRDDRPLADAVRRYFRLWHTALEAAGIDLKDRNQAEK